MRSWVCGETVHVSEMDAESGALCRRFLRPRTTLGRSLIQNPCPSRGAKFGPALYPVQGSPFWILKPVLDPHALLIAADVLLNDSENLEKRFGQGALPELDPAISLASALMVRTEGWKLAVSSRGFLAFIPEETRKGNMISIIKDSEEPFILRSSEKGYSMTRECYVRGIMDGEAYDVMESNGSTGKIKLI